MCNRRTFLQNSIKASAAVYAGSIGFSAKSYGRIIGANDRVNVGVVGFSDRFRSSLFPSFLEHNKELNFDVLGVSDIWSLRRNEGVDHLGSKIGHTVKGYRNNEELYQNKDIDAVIISTSDFQHALHCVEAMKAGKMRMLKSLLLKLWRTIGQL